MPEEAAIRIKANIEKIKANIAAACTRANRDPATVFFLPVTKKRPKEELDALRDLGYHEFGESYTEDILERFKEFDDITWHYIGHLHKKHTNKIVGNVTMIHSVASEELLRKVDFTAGEKHLVQDILIEVNSGEQQKQGFEPDEVRALFQKEVFKGLPNVRVRGLMTMAPLVDDPQKVRPVFAAMKALRNGLNKDFHLDLKELSMGMTNDYIVAVEEGATIVRIGTAVFEG
jgi:PLP dependent protein